MFSFFGMNTALIFQMVALLVALTIEIKYDDKRWKRLAIIVAILLSLVAGIVGWIYETERNAAEQIEKTETSRVLTEIGTGVSGVTTTSKDSLAQLNKLRERNVEQQALISDLNGSVRQANLQSQRAYAQYRAAQDQVISLSQEVVALQERINRDSAAAQAARAVAAEESRQQTMAANRAAAQAACAASYRCSADGMSCSTIYPDLRAYGGGSCLNGVYNPPR